MKENEDKATREQTLSFMTTEHFTLQTARSATVGEANGRVQLYIGAVSSAVVAMAFIGQTSGMHEGFFVFSLVLFPSLLFLGIVTFDRVLQTALEDWIYGHLINQIRLFYSDLSTETSNFFDIAVYDDPENGVAGLMDKPHTWQYFLTSSGMVAGINSIIAGVFISLIARFGFSTSIYICAAVGIVIFAVSLYLHHLRQLSRFAAIGERMKKRIERQKRARE